MGKVSHQLARELAHAEFEKFHKKQLALETEKVNEDFERVAKQVANRRKKE